MFLGLGVNLARAEENYTPISSGEESITTESGAPLTTEAGDEIITEEST